MYGDSITTQKPTAFTKLNTFMPSSSTIGVGLSILKKTITFVYENQTESYKLNFSTNMNIIPHVWEAQRKNIQDNISVNFGKYPFKYYLPGFISYQEYRYIAFSCIQNLYFNLNFAFACLYVFITK